MVPKSHKICFSIHKEDVVRIESSIFKDKSNQEAVTDSLRMDHEKGSGLYKETLTFINRKVPYFNY